ncbi:hypothetical protein AMTR_s00081p00129210 [Amborella trichopoda]|uniref:Uncharacterized protein n=1 Tax=Amborella trichopoda TaxID=13333 RepID=W1P9A6_AMBTC|nr:hypothetical protein AMTR_s00081p00129210 [Amborella trichopoda]
MKMNKSYTLPCRAPPKAEALLDSSHEEAPLKQLEYEREDIDKRAEAFIKKFRERVEIERMDSIENYFQMLARDI